MLPLVAIFTIWVLLHGQGQPYVDMFTTPAPSSQSPNPPGSTRLGPVTIAPQYPGQSFWQGIWNNIKRGPFNMPHPGQGSGQ